MSNATMHLLMRTSHVWPGQIFVTVLLINVVAVLLILKSNRCIRAGEPISTTLRLASLGAKGCIPLSWFVFVVLTGHLGCAASVAKQAQCRSNLKVLGEAVVMYMQDWDETLPASSNWAETILPRVTKTCKDDGRAEVTPESVYHCPASDRSLNYAMNGALDSHKLGELDQPATTVLLFEAAPAPGSHVIGKSLVGGRQLLDFTNHGFAHIAFMDGHVKFTNSAALAQELQWSVTPPSTKK